MRAHLSPCAPRRDRPPADRTAAALLSKAGILVIEVDRRLAKVACDAVVLDNERGGREATSICWSWGTRGSRSSSPIQTGRATRAASTATSRTSRTAPTSTNGSSSRLPSMPGTRKSGSTLLAERRPTAIFAANNELAEHAACPARRGFSRRTTSRSWASTTSAGWRWSTRASPWSRAAAFEMGRAPRAFLRQAADPGAAVDRDA